MRRLRFYKLNINRRLLLLLWGAEICAVIVGSLLPASVLDGIHYDDKLVHFVNYAVLAMLPAIGLEALSIGMACAAAMVPMGVCIEFLQRLVPGRTFEIADMIANALGVVAGVLLALLVKALLTPSQLLRKTQREP